jgi:enoyl-CoA hydratase/carnithine racemase
MILPLVLERMAPQKARLWAITASSRTAQEAFEAGLVDQVVPHERLERAGQRWARQLGRARPSGLDRLARFSAQATHLSLEDALAEGGRITLEATGDAEVRNALRSFRDHGTWEDL